MSLSSPFGTPHFRYSGGELWCEEVPVSALAARYGTPLYVYTRAAIEERFAALREAFGGDAQICFAVKSNGNLALLRLLAGLGAGFDLVSGGELERLRRAGVPTGGAVFAGVGKDEEEVRAAHAAGILFFNVESAFEIEMFERIGTPARPVPVALRLNPDVDAGTHHYISTGRGADKFGMDLATAGEVAARVAASPRLELVGYHVHLGSQVRSTAPYLAALDVLERFLDAAPARGRGIRYYDLGGGFAVAYGEAGGGTDIAALAAAVRPRLAARGLRPVLEPGRFLVADAGILVARVLGTKGRFTIVDAAMNDLLRPALYRAEHPVAPVRPRDGELSVRDVVGPVCESADFLALGRPLPPLAPGDLLSVCSAGAYGSAMASNYNSRRRPAEVLVAGGEATLIRRRERYEDLWAAEVDL